MNRNIVLVTGARRFIGRHLQADLRRLLHQVRAAHIKPVAEWYQRLNDWRTVTP